MLSEIQFGEFLPDFPNYKSPGCVRADNVFPSAGGYGPLRGAGNTSGSTSGVCRGAALFRRSTGDAITVGGGDDKLWVDVSGTLTATTGLTSIGSDAYWQFEQFGARVFAVAPNNDLKVLDAIDSDTSWASVSDAPTQAEVIGRVGKRLVVGCLSSNPYGFQWSGDNDPITFTANATNFAGTAEVDHDFGKITGIAGRRYPLLFQEYGVSRIAEVGPKTVFQIDRVEEARGAIAPNSIVTVGYFTYFLSDDGFWVTNGAGAQALGTRRVNEFFKDDVSAADMFRTHGTVDWGRQCVIWSYYRQGSTGFDGLIIYSWAENRWATGTLALHWLVQGTTDATTLEDLDATYPDLDAMPISLDSAIFLSQGRNLSAYLLSGSNTELTSLDGDALAATFETGEWQTKTAERSFVSEIYPIVENVSENTQAQIITRSPKGGVESVSTAGTVNDAGFCPVRADGRYLRVRMTIPAGADWSKAQGVQVKHRASGAR